MQAGIEEGDEPLDQRHLRSGKVRGEGIGAQQHGRARHILGEGLADAGRMGIDGLGLVGDHVGDRDALVLEQPDAGVEAVHQGHIVGHPVPVDIGPRRRDLLACRRVQGRLLEPAGGIRAGDPHHLIALQLHAVDLHRHHEPPRSNRQGLIAGFLQSRQDPQERL